MNTTFTDILGVAISDVHYDLATLEVADASMNMAIDKANDFNVPLIVTGDLHNTKASMRGECVNAMIKTFKRCKIKPFIVVGNHDKINEKSEEHSLNFLEPYATLINEGLYYKKWLILPYFHDKEKLKKVISEASTNNIIMHQGLIGSNSGEYFNDKSAITPEDVAGKRVISGHYHRRQNILLPQAGMWTYLGNPYTLNFGEANDPEKGFHILYSNGTLDFYPTNLRKHSVADIHTDSLDAFMGDMIKANIKANDLLLLKIRGNVAGLDKKTVADKLGLTQSFKLDLEQTKIEAKSIITESPAESLDSMIDSLNVDKGQKARLKDMWRGFEKK